MELLKWPSLTDWATQARPQIYALTALQLVCNFTVSRVLPHRIRNTTVWAYWNLALAVYSLATFLAITPWFLQLSWNEVICDRIWQQVDDQYLVQWNSVFVISKVLELGDTVFLWLDKKPVKFLHWFHHATVLLQSWHSMETHSTSGYTFVVMNSGIHAIMYFQYFLALQKIKVPQWIAGLITLLQISQMVVGVVIQCQVIDRVFLSNEECGVTRENVIGGSLMYLAYLILFCQQAVDRQVFNAKDD